MIAAAKWGGNALLCTGRGARDGAGAPPWLPGGHDGRHPGAAPGRKGTQSRRPEMSAGASLQRLPLALDEWSAPSELFTRSLVKVHHWRCRVPASRVCPHQ